MARFLRRQGSFATATALGEFERVGRERGLDLLQATEEIFTGIRAPSRLGTALFSVALAGVGIDERDPSYGAYLGTALMGYACRMAQAAPPQPENEVARVERHLLRGADGRLDYDALSEQPDRLRGLLEYLGELEERRFHRLLGESPETWEVFTTMATMQLHRNLSRNGLRRRYLPEPETVRGLLDLGYPVRFIDEVAGEQPLVAAALY